MLDAGYWMLDIQKYAKSDIIKGFYRYGESSVSHWSKYARCRWLHAGVKAKNCGFF